MKKTIIKQIVLNVFIILVAVVAYNGVSYSINDDESVDNKDVLIETGNMQVVLNVPKEKYEFLNTLKLGVSDELGKMQDGYSFTVTNTGNIPIDYYEIRLIDEENKISTLPHKYLRFTIKKDSDKYSDIKNLGDVDSIIYHGKNLDIGKSASFNLKMWLDNSIKTLNDKTLYSAIEVILYQKFDMFSNYVLYDSEDGNNIPYRTSIYSPISSMVPIRDGYDFLGWSTVLNGDVVYHGGDTYREEKGGTLYAVWQKKEES